VGSEMCIRDRDDSIERIKEIGPFTSKDAIEKITNIVKKRVDLLERELSE